MTKIRDYEARAEECRTLASLMHNPEHARILREIGMVWESLVGVERIREGIKCPLPIING